MGWGGKRPGAGRKIAAAADTAAAKPPAPVPVPKPEPPLDLSQMLAAIAESRETANDRPRTEEWCPYRIAEHPDRATPPERLQMAQDSALVANNDWAVAAWMAGGLLSGAASEGLMFPGYPYLAELAQRPEYRTFAETIANEATRKWIEFKSVNKGTEDQLDKSDRIRELNDFLTHLKLRDTCTTLVAQDCLFGRSHLFLDSGASDEELTTPIGNGRDQLSDGKVGKDWLKAVRAIEAVWTYPQAYNAVNPLRSDWYSPQTWFVMGKNIHVSRLLTFVGRPVPDLLKPAYSFGGISLSQLAKPYVDIWLRTRESVGEIIHAFSVMVLSTDLAGLIAPNAPGGGLLTRVALFNGTRDNQGLMVINKATEEFQNVAAPISGLHELQAQAQEHMMAVARIPAIVFTGIQPMGLNASSDGELRVFHDTIASTVQQRLLRPNLDIVIDMAMRTLWGERDEDITYDFVPLWTESEKDAADRRKTDADTDQIYIDTGVLAPVEVRHKVALDPDAPYHDIDPDDVPDLLEEEEEGLEPEGGRPQPQAEADVEKERGGEDHALSPFLLAGDAFEWLETDHPRGEGGKFTAGSGSSSSGKFKAPQYGLPFGPAKHGSSSSSPSVPAPKKTNIGEPLDVSKLKKVGGQKGSNPGGVYEGENGKQFYVKQGKSPAHVRNEMAAAALYDLAGTPTLKYRPVEGGAHIATEIAKLDKDNAHKLSPQEIAEARRDFAVHAWLANWDAVGTGGDNIGTVKGVPTALDLGGALAYRAMGSPKGDKFGTSVGELDTLRSAMNPDAQKVFGAITPAELRESARFVTSIPDGAIRKAVGDDKALADKLIARKKDIAQRAALFGAEGDPRKKTSTMVVPSSMAAPVKELNGIAFKPWRPPADWASVEGQADIGEPAFEPPAGKRAASGLVIREPDGRVWLVRPSNGFGGYEHTFPKGGIDEGLSPQANAIKEAWEESGIKARIVGHAGDHEGDTSFTRYYMAEREAGDPGQHDTETDGVVLTPASKLEGFLNRKRDRSVAESLAQDAAFEESEHPRAPDGKFTAGAGGGGGGGEGGTAAEPKYWYQKFKPSKDVPHWAEQTGEALKAKIVGTGGAGSNYRKVLVQLLDEAKKFGTEGGDLGKKLKANLILSWAKAHETLTKKSDWAGAAKIAAKMKQLGGEAESSFQAAAKADIAKLPPAPKPTPEQQKQEVEKSVKALMEPSKPAATPATPQELEKAKKSIPLQLQYVPGAPQTPVAQMYVDVFNEKWAGKEGLSQQQLEEKVADFKQLAANMVPLMSAAQKAAAEQQAKQAEQQAKASAEATEKVKAAKAAVAKQLKEYQDALGISETEAFGFAGVVDMLGKYTGVKNHELIDKFKDFAKQAEKYNYPISGFEYALIRSYIDGTYDPMNEALRTQKALPAEVHTYTRLLNNALTKMPKYTGMVKRGTSLSDAHIAEHYVPGHIVEEKAFTSCGINNKFGGNVEYKIKAIGKRGADFSHGANVGESEVLFKAKTNFMVHKVHKQGGTTYIEMEEVESYD